MAIRLNDTSITQIGYGGGTQAGYNPNAFRNIQELNAVLNQWRLKMSNEKPGYANLIQKHAKLFSVSDFKDYNDKLEVLDRLRKGEKSSKKEKKKEKNKKKEKKDKEEKEE